MSGYHADTAGNVVRLNSSVFKRFAKKVKGIKNSLSNCAFSGSKNLRLSNVEDHARGYPYKKALNLHLVVEKGPV